MSPESNIHEDSVGKSEVDPEAIARMQAAQRRLAELSPDVPAQEAETPPKSGNSMAMDEEKYQAIKRDLLMRAPREEDEAGI
jgi:hypothetical protein